MITERIGDLLTDSQVNVIAHQCNCFHTMGGGIARVIAQQFPEAVKADNETVNGDDAKMGTFSVATARRGDKTIRIVNMYGQFRTSNSERMTRYDSLHDALKTLEATIAQSNNPDKYIVGVPYGLGSALGGGSWTIVRAILEHVFGKSPVQLHIVRLPNVPDLE